MSAERSISGNTRRQLISAIKQLMSTQSFRSIRVNDICDLCHINRKSFYYHYKDKFDLVNNVFYTEFILPACQKHYVSDWDLLSDMSRYMYGCKAFYRNALLIRGQNSFYDYFTATLESICAALAASSPGCTRNSAKFLSRMLASAFEYWLNEKDPLSPESFIATIRPLLLTSGNSLSAVAGYGSDFAALTPNA